jgi:hypothetical protein
MLLPLYLYKYEPPQTRWISLFRLPLIIATPASIIIFVLPVPVAPVRFLRLTPVLWPLFPVLSPGRLLLLI